MVRWPIGKELEYVYLIVVAGHVAAGKNNFTERLLHTLNTEGIPVTFQANHKDRMPRPSEIVGADIIPWPTKDPSVIWLRDDDKYGIQEAVIDALRQNRVHQVINADIAALPGIRAHFAQIQLPNKVVPIGLYCDELEAKDRIIKRERRNPNQLLAMIRQLESLPTQISQYRNHHKEFRYLFYNPYPASTLDRLVDRTIDLLGREERAKTLDFTGPFINRYMTDIVYNLFPRASPSTLETLANRGEIKTVNFTSADFKAFRERFGQRDGYGEISDDYLQTISKIEVTDIVNAYGVLNVMVHWEAGLVLNAREFERRRTILQQLLQVRVGKPQYVNQDKPSFHAYSEIGRIECIDNLVSPIISFSSHDVFPLLAQSLPPVKEAPHTLTFHYYLARNPQGRNIVYPSSK